MIYIQLFCAFMLVINFLITLKIFLMHNKKDSTTGEYKWYIPVELIKATMDTISCVQAVLESNDRTIKSSSEITESIEKINKRLGSLS